MRRVSEGIMLSSTKCGDGKMVVNVYTREEGKRGFLVRLPSSSAGKGRMKASFFFPLSQIEATFSEPRQGQDLVYLNDVKVVYAYREMYTDIRKSSVACFLAEVMGRCILQSEQDIRFYDTVATALRQFDARHQDIADFHLFFLLSMAESLGFYPQEAGHFTDIYFDMREGRFVSTPPAYEDFLAPEVACDLSLLLQVRRRSRNAFPEITLFDSRRRQALLMALAAYCRIQTGIAGNFRSLDILREVFQ